MRSTLTAFGVFWGIFMLVILLGAGNGLRNGVTNQFNTDAINAIWIWGGETNLAYKGLEPGRRIQLENRDLNFVEAHIKSNNIPSLKASKKCGFQEISVNEISIQKKRASEKGWIFMRCTKENFKNL